MLSRKIYFTISGEIYSQTLNDTATYMTNFQDKTSRCVSIITQIV